VQEAIANDKPFLDEVRRLTQAIQVDVVCIAQNQLAMFIDNFGLLKGDTQRYWRFQDAPMKVAGRALILAVDPENGFIAPIRADSIDRVREGIVWIPESVKLLRIEEMILVDKGEVPRIVRRPVFSDDEHEEVKPFVDPALMSAPSRWIVSARPDGSVKAVRYLLTGDELTPAQMITAKDIEALRPLLPPNLVRSDPEDNDPPEIIEYLSPKVDEAAA
jgi:hypothetical protein